MCGDIVINTYKTKSLNISYGCIGSHLGTELGDNGIIIGIPIEKLEEIVNGLELME